MANARFRSMPVYAGSKKIAEIQNCSLDYESNDEAQEGSDAHLGHSDGIAMSAVDCEVVCPTTGLSVDPITFIKNKEYVNIGVQLFGKLYQFTARCTKFNVKSTSKNGKTTGSFRFEGGDLT